jgi:mannose-6-phosphate isomerase-like protein (cupin superfamily)
MMRITRADAAPPYQPPLHYDVTAVRLQGHEAGDTSRFWVGRSQYPPGGRAGEAPTAEETVYVVLDGELVVTANGQSAAVGPGDSVHLPKGTVRSIENRSGRDAVLLVVIALPEAAP